MTVSVNAKADSAKLGDGKRGRWRGILKDESGGQRYVGKVFSFCFFLFFLSVMYREEKEKEKKYFGTKITIEIVSNFCFYILGWGLGFGLGQA